MEWSRSHKDNICEVDCAELLSSMKDEIMRFYPLFDEIQELHWRMTLNRVN